MNTEESSSDRAYPVARRIQAHSSSFDRLLLDLARDKHPSVVWWWGVRPDKSQRLAKCYVCDEIMADWWSSTKTPESVVALIKMHRRDHIDQLMIQAATAEAPQ